MAKPVTPRQRVKAGTATMVSPQGKGTIFDYYNDRGLIPAKDQQGSRFRDFEEFKNTVQTRTTAYLNANPDKTPQQSLNLVLSQLEQNRLARRDPVRAAEAVEKADQAKRGTVYKGIPFKIDEDGIVDFDKRKYMSNLPQPVYDYIADTRGEDVAKEYKKAVKKEWKDMGARGREFKSKTGVEVHRGHWLANKFGGAESARAADLEIAMMNVLHGADPRGSVEAVKESSRISMGWLDDFYEWDLVNNKLNVPGSELLTVEDLQGISTDEVDVNQRIAQRLEEQRMGTLPEDRVGNLFGSEVREGETLEQAKFRKQEEQARFILENDYNPQTGNPANQKDYADARKTIREAESRMRATTVGPKKQTDVVKSRPELFQQLPPEPMPSPVQPKMAPTTPRQPQPVQQKVVKVIPRGVQQKGGKVKYQRQMVRNLAVAGVGSLSVLGTAASAVETGMRAGMAAESFQRGDIRGGLMDVGQTVLSGLSTVADVVPGIGEVVSTPADIANIVIDEARMAQEVKQQQEQARQSAQAKSRARNLRRGTGARGR
jgi:hypothetical protein